MLSVGAALGVRRAAPPALALEHFWREFDHPKVGRIDPPEFSMAAGEREGEEDGERRESMRGRKTVKDGKV